jgi:hypothetical protein
MMPFLFVAGTIASSADQLGSVSIGGYNFHPQGVAEFGKFMVSSTREAVSLEVGLVRRIFIYFKEDGYFNASNTLSGIKYTQRQNERKQ